MKPDLTQQSVDTVVGYIGAALHGSASCADEAIDMAAVHYKIHRDKIAKVWIDYVLGLTGNSGETVVTCTDYRKGLI